METEDFHDWSSNCKLETQESWWYNSVSLNVWEPRVLWARKDQYPSSNTRQKKTEFFLLLFCSILALSRLDVQPYWGGRLTLLSPLILISSGDTLTGEKKMFRQISRHPVIQSRWHIKLTITVCLEHIWRNERQVWVLATAKGVSEARNSSPNINSV